MIRILFTLLFVTFFFSAAITPYIYESLRLIWVGLPWPFSRVYDRVAMAVALLMVIYYRKQFSLHTFLVRIRSVNRRELAVAFVALVVTTAITWATTLILIPGERVVWNGVSLADMLVAQLLFLPAAILISIIEEGFFRFILFDRLRTHAPVFLAMLASSLLYALVHFVSPVKTFQRDEYHLISGFEYLGTVAQRMFDPAILPAYFGLVLVGMVLCLLRLKLNCFYICVCVHAAWVLVMKGLAAASTTAPGYEFPPGVGRRYYLLSEPLVWATILLTGLCLLVLARRFLPQDLPEHASAECPHKGQ